MPAKRPGQKDLCPQIPQTVQSHKTPETEHVYNDDMLICQIV